MARTATLKQSDLTRYAKALQAARIEAWRVIVHPDGTHEIIVHSGEGPDHAVNDWDCP